MSTTNDIDLREQQERLEHKASSMRSDVWLFHGVRLPAPALKSLEPASASAGIYGNMEVRLSQGCPGNVRLLTDHIGLMNSKYPCGNDQDDYVSLVQRLMLQGRALSATISSKGGTPIPEPEGSKGGGDVIAEAATFRGWVQASALRSLAKPQPKTPISSAPGIAGLSTNPTEAPTPSSTPLALPASGAKLSATERAIAAKAGKPAAAKQTDRKPTATERALAARKAAK